MRLCKVTSFYYKTMFPNYMYSQIPTYEDGLMMSTTSEALNPSPETVDSSYEFWHWNSFYKFWHWGITLNPVSIFCDWGIESLRKISQANYFLQIAALSIALPYLGRNFHEHLGNLAVSWISLLHTTIIGGTVGLAFTVLQGRTEERNPPSPEILRDRALQNAINSFLPWISSAVSIGFASALYMF